MRFDPPTDSLVLVGLSFVKLSGQSKMKDLKNNPLLILSTKYSRNSDNSLPHWSCNYNSFAVVL